MGAVPTPTDNPDRTTIGREKLLSNVPTSLTSSLHNILVTNLSSVFLDFENITQNILETECGSLPENNGSPDFECWRGLRSITYDVNFVGIDFQAVLFRNPDLAPPANSFISDFSTSVERMKANATQAMQFIDNIPAELKVNLSNCNLSLDQILLPQLIIAPTPGISTDISPSINTDINPSISTDINPSISTDINPSISTDINPSINTDINPNISTDINPSISTDNPSISTDINPSISTDINPSINTDINPNISTDINPSISTDINPSISTDINPSISTDINPSISTDINPSISTDINPSINTDINPSINTDINPSISTDINPSINTDINPSISTDINPSISSDINPSISTDINPSISTDINPSISTDMTPATELIESTVGMMNPTPTSTINGSAKKTGLNTGILLLSIIVLVLIFKE